MPPIPRVTGLAASYNNPPGTVSLSAATSTVGPNPVYQWVVVEYPPSLLTPPALTGANTATPTLTGVTARGTYIVFLKITDDTGSSHPAPYPTQSTAEPFNFTSPLSTSFGVVRVKEASGLVKPGRGQYGWIEDLWAVIDKLGQAPSLDFYDEATHTLTADSIIPYSQGTDIIVNGLKIQDQETAGLNDPWALIYHDISGDFVTVNFQQHAAALSSFDGLNVTGTGQLLVEVESIDMSADVGDLTLRAGDEIQLTPGSSTVSLKPLRAPGLQLSKAYFTKSDATISGDLLELQPVFTRHEVGSELSLDLTLALDVVAGSGTSWELNRIVDGVTTNIVSSSLGSSAAGWRILSIKSKIKISWELHTITETQFSSTGVVTPGGAGAVASSPVSQCMFKEEELVGKDVTFQFKLIDPVNAFSAQATFSLYNPHDQDVI